jgi:hypothetical protein
LLFLDLWFERCDFSKFQDISVLKSNSNSYLTEGLPRGAILLADTGSTRSTIWAVGFYDALMVQIIP